MIDEHRPVCGVDGCRAGWIAALSDTRATAPPDLRVMSTNEVAELASRGSIVVIDIPIGLLSERARGGRPCDIEARRLLAVRRSSVFPAPIRPALDAKEYREAASMGLSQQAYALVPKIREVDQCMTPKLQDNLLESHPELAFRSLTGEPQPNPKKTDAGRRERLVALASAAGSYPAFAGIEDAFQRASRSFLRKDVALDDIVDAYAMLWVALRVAADMAKRCPEQPDTDAKGLRMEMWY